MLKASERENLEEIQLAHEPDLRLGEALLRPASRLLEIDGRKILLEPRVAQLLVALGRENGEVLGRDALVDLCWGGRIVGEDAINRCVGKARRAAAPAGIRIETVPRVGYRLVARSPRDRRRLWWISGLAGALILAGALVFLIDRQSSKGRAEYPVIAIGAFTTTSSEPAIRANASAISAQVVDALTKSGIPTVRPGGSGAARARYVIQGQVSAAGDSVHALIQMDDVRTRIAVISQELDLDQDEIPLLADKIAAAAADAVTRTGAYYALTSRSDDPADTASFMDVALKVAEGNYLEAELNAQRFYESHPNSRLAPFALSHSTMYALPLHPDEERAEALARARTAARVARERLPEFGDVYLAQCNLYPRDYVVCEKNARQGLAVDPSAPTLRSQLALLLMDAGRLRDAHPLVVKALADTPYNPSKVVHNLYIDDLLNLKTEEQYVWAYAQRYWPRLRFARQRFASLMAAGRWREAEVMLPLFLRVEPGSADRMRILFQALRLPTQDNKSQAERACVDDLESGASVVCFTALSMLGRTKAALTVATAFYPPTAVGTPAQREVRFLQNITAPRPLFMIWGDGAKTMRQDPAFADFVKKRGLVQYWKTAGAPDACRRDPAPFCKLV